MGIKQSIYRRLPQKLKLNIDNARKAPLSDPFVDDVQYFTKGQLKRRSDWRALLRDSGEAKRLDALKGIHQGKRAFIVGNGPSINSQDLSLLSKEITFVTNWFANHESYDVIQPTYYCISSHEVFGGWDASPPELNADMKNAIMSKDWRSVHFFPVWAREALISDPDFDREKLNFLIFERPKATLLERGRMNWDLKANLDDGLTGVITFCLPLCLHMGITEVFLVGCDCDYGIKEKADPKAYFYDFSKHTTSTSKFETLSRVWGEGGEIFQVYEIVRREAEKRGLRIYNATAGGLLEVFPRVSYEEVLSANAEEHT